MIQNTPISAKDAAQALHLPGSHNKVSNVPVGMLVKRLADLDTLQREQGDTLTPQALHVLDEIAQQPGLTMQDIAGRTHLSLASVSRNLMALGEQHRIGQKAGLNFVEVIEDPVERRRKIAFLTPEGRQFMAQRLKILTGQEVIFDSPTATQFKRRHIHR